MQHIVVISMLLLVPLKVFAFTDYYVDWPSSKDGVHILRISIDGCDTLFKIKDKDFYSFTGSKEAVQDALKKAIARSSSGCKN